MTERWTRSIRALPPAYQPHGKRLVDLAKAHSSEAFFGCDNAFEAALYSVLAETARQQDRPDKPGDCHVDP
jgi:hypothetical protein